MNKEEALKDFQLIAFAAQKALLNAQEHQQVSQSLQRLKPFFVDYNGQNLSSVKSSDKIVKDDNK